MLDNRSKKGTNSKIEFLDLNEKHIINKTI